MPGREQDELIGGLHRRDEGGDSFMRGPGKTRALHACALVENGDDMAHDRNAGDRGSVLA